MSKKPNWGGYRKGAGRKREKEKLAREIEQKLYVFLNLNMSG